MMKAVVREMYGGPEVLTLQDVETPLPGPNEVRVRVAAVSLNLSDWECLTGKPAYSRVFGLFRPGRPILGSDITGTVEVVGERVTRFRPGDEVFGDAMGTFGGFAECAVVPEKVLHPKPPDLSFPEVSTVIQSGPIAVQGLTQGCPLRKGERVLINGAGGGSGMFAIQLAKAAGAHVTAVDTGHKAAHMRSLGADGVVDYRQTDFTRTGEQYDLIVDLVANRSVWAHQRALLPGGRYGVVGGSVGSMLQTMLFGPLVGLVGRRRHRVLAIEPRAQDYEQLFAAMREQALQVRIERTFSLDEVGEALRSMHQGEVLGKVVVTP